jgi:hypothetical protein
MPTICIANERLADEKGVVLRRFAWKAARENDRDKNLHNILRTYIPGQPDDGIERGLLGYFINSNIENQYEFEASSLGTMEAGAVVWAHRVVHAGCVADGEAAVVTTAPVVTVPVVRPAGAVVAPRAPVVRRRAY